jgi:hypothetical protein
VGFVRRRISTASVRGSTKSIGLVAREFLREIRANEPTSTEVVPLLDWVEQKAPDLERFDYFAPYADALERAARGEGLRLAFAAPPQHGKTVFTLYALLWIATFFPGKRHAYVTYNATRTEEVAKDFQRLADTLGIAWTGTLKKMWFPGGTTIKFTSINGGITGAGLDGLCIIDDPIKGAKEARSPTIRADAIGWWKSEARTRRHQGTSYIVMATRWHIEDLSGYLVKREKWKYLNFKAIAEPANDNDVGPDGRVLSDPIHRFPGESLCPKRKPPEFFAEERTDLYWWYAMYQGVPQPIGGEIFRAPAYYRLPPGETLPDLKGFRIAYGVDLAYSKSTSRDYSVVIEIWAVPDPKLKETVGEQERPVVWFYVVDVTRKQVDAPAFTLTLKAKSQGPESRPGKLYWYAAGPEKGSGDFIKKAGVPLVVLDTKGRDKLMRAQRTAQLWNMGRIMVPLAADDPDGDSSISWVAEFVEEVCAFTGVKDPKDDQVDAMVPAIDKLEASWGADLEVSGGGGRGWGR